MRAVALLLLSQLQLASEQKVPFIFRQDSSFDRFTNSVDFMKGPWLQNHFARMMVYSPYFDSKINRYSGALVYVNLYAIPKDSGLAVIHPEWLLQLSGDKGIAFVPYDCERHTCPQFAADLTNPDYRRWWVDEARRLVAHGYRGLWIDDVNMAFRISDHKGQFSPPLDRFTQQPMTEQQWRTAVAVFTEEIRKALPQAEIIHNCIWFAGPSAIRDADPWIQRQLQSADFVNLERGVNDKGLQGGTGEWSLRAFLSFIDRVHALKRHVVMDDLSTTERERQYAMAALLLITDGDDRIGNQSMTPENWWTGYDVDLGRSKGPRRVWNRLLRRDFEGGLVLLNEPGKALRTIAWPPGFISVNGQAAKTLTLDAQQGIILLKTRHLNLPRSAGSGLHSSRTGRSADLHLTN